MTTYKYSSKKFGENTAHAVGRFLSFSTKQAIEVCSYIRKKNLQRAKTMLEEVLAKKRALPYKRFTDGAGHKKGMASGKYPEKTCGQILKLLKQVEANAQVKALDTNNLWISHICAQQAARPWKYGRHRRRQAKRTHVEIIVEEKISEKKTVPKKNVEAKEKAQEPKKPEAKKPVQTEKREAMPKPEVKKEQVKAETKKETTKQVPKPKAPNKETLEKQSFSDSQKRKTEENKTK